MAKKVRHIGCSCVKALEEGQMFAAATRAVEENPANAPSSEMMAPLMATALVGEVSAPQMIAVMTSKYWGVKGRAFGVRFLDNPTTGCRNKILAHMNAWSERCNISFKESSSGEIRISRAAGGYWSYLGTDILQIGSGKATMNLEGFTEKTPDSEYKRVVRHETGHTLGCPHEHMRRALIEQLDRNKTISYFAQTQGWNATTTTQQVLTPVEESSLLGSPTVDDDSIMCYQLPGSITKTGKPIPGGSDITENDFAFMSKLYPKTVDPTSPPTDAKISVSVSVSETISALQKAGYEVKKS